MWSIGNIGRKAEELQNQPVNFAYKVTREHAQRLTSEGHGNATWQGNKSAHQSNWKVGETPVTVESGSGRTWFNWW